jgi:two-component system phosphate regulon sensor histidine kinase PhoR
VLTSVNHLPIGSLKYEVNLIFTANASTLIVRNNQMKKHVRLVFFLAAATVSFIVLFQVYWVYNSYRIEERNFYKSVTIALQNSINAYPLREIKLPETFKANSPALSVISSMEKAPPSKQIGADTSTQLFNLKFEPLQVPGDNLSQVKEMVAMLMAKNAGSPLKTDVLSSILYNELLKNNIDVSFKLVVLKDQKTLPINRAAAFVTFSKDNDVVVAEMTNVRRYLLPRIFIPALVSLILTFLSAASLYYMGIIIRRQLKMDSMKNNFFSNIAHELRTPISILKSTHEALHKFGESVNPETTSRYLQINTTILDKLDNNVDRILDITRYEQGAKTIHIEKVDLNALIDEMVTEFKANEQASIQYDLPDKSCVDTDKYIIQTILSNLVDNAIKYAGRQVNIQVMVRLSAHHWELEVRDDGQGISEQHLPFIFDKFYRVPSGDIHNVKGYGLGLSYVKELVASLDGKIAVKSKTGVGTSFTTKFQVYG